MFIFPRNASEWNDLASALLILCLVAFILSLVYAVVRNIDYATWNSETAQIIELIERKSEEGSSAFVAVFAFTDSDGKEWKVESSYASHPPVGEVGDDIGVLYETHNPENAILNTYFARWGIPTILLVVGGANALIFGLIKLYTGKRMRANKSAYEIAGTGGAIDS